MTERLIAKGNQFMYTEEHIQRGTEGCEHNLNQFREMLTSPDETLRNAARQAVPDYEATLRYVHERTPGEMLSELRKIWENIIRLEEQGLPEEEINENLYRNHGVVIYLYRDVLNEGWIESAMQAVTTARIREYNIAKKSGRPD